MNRSLTSVRHQYSVNCLQPRSQAARVLSSTVSHVRSHEAFAEVSCEGKRSFDAQEALGLPCQVQVPTSIRIVSSTPV
eukprot:3879590-Pleurochrysis_carterae.AAC.1